MKLIMTKGLPASGKTTWAKNQNAIRINKDDLRSMLHNGKWSRENEKEVIRARDTLIKEFLPTRNVIVDDTNLASKHQERLKQLARELKSDFEVKDFTDVSVEECIKRDQKRPNYVGEKVIKDMYNQFLRPPAVAPEYNHDLPECIMCDIDGTLAIMGDRSPFDWEKVGLDTVNEAVKEALYERGHYTIIVSGRDEICRKQTEEWLSDNDITYKELYMRHQGDNRKDSIVKREIYENHIKGKYNVLFVLDDRDQVVDLWRRDLGLPCFQVNYGDF